MDKKILKRAVTSSVSFSILPSVSILLGVNALSGTLGIPLSWLRLSVVGSLQYELNVAEIAAKSMGLSGLKVSEMTVDSYTTIALVMTMGIVFGAFCCLFALKKYMNKVQSRPKTEGKKKNSSGFAIVAMFIGLCSAYIGSYVGILTSSGDYIPLMTAVVSAVVMAVFEYFTVKRGKAWLDNLSVATSMLLAMTAAALVSL